MPHPRFFFFNWSDRWIIIWNYLKLSINIVKQLFFSSQTRKTIEMLYYLSYFQPLDLEVSFQKDRRNYWSFRNSNCKNLSKCKNVKRLAEKNFFKSSRYLKSLTKSVEILKLLIGKFCLGHFYETLISNFFIDKNTWLKLYLVSGRCWCWNYPSKRKMSEQNMYIDGQTICISKHSAA